jgi:hypothetical protein
MLNFKGTHNNVSDRVRNYKTTRSIAHTRNIMHTTFQTETVRNNKATRYITETVRKAEIIDKIDRAAAARHSNVSEKNRTTRDIMFTRPCTKTVRNNKRDYKTARNFMYPRLRTGIR